MKLIWRTADLRVCISTAESFSGPFTLANDQVSPDAKLEDFFLFKKDGRYHLICEDNAGKITGHERWGAYLESVDGVHDWHPAMRPIAYDHCIQWADKAEQLNVTRRERPWLLIENGRVTQLFTAVSDGRRAWNQPTPFSMEF